MSNYGYSNKSMRTPLIAAVDAVLCQSHRCVFTSKQRKATGSRKRIR